MRPRYLVLIIVAFLPTIVGLGGGRPAISGRVTNAQTGEPLQNANVFLAGTLIGATSARDGSFLLAGFPPGFHMLVVSCVGYDVQTQQVQIEQADSMYLVFDLHQRLIEQKEVIVQGERPEEWNRLLKYFKSAFIGETENASLCTIMNPEVINLFMRPGTKTLVASADRSLFVENRGLGYRLEIILSKFEWDIDEDLGTYVIYPAFRELTPRAGEGSQWAAQRNRTYMGSLKHFLAALVAGKVEKEGFHVQNGSLTELKEGFGHPISPDELFMVRDPLSGYWNVTFKGWVRVQYKNQGQRLTSYITRNGGEIQVDYLGNMADPLRISVVGDWAMNRVAELLPPF